jgi:hypothetical protein
MGSKVSFFARMMCVFVAISKEKEATRQKLHLLWLLTHLTPIKRGKAFNSSHPYEGSDNEEGTKVGDDCHLCSRRKG